ncbi:proline racemase [Megasphaera cerevisiae DSM 20462]|jgi:proline racemase/trans-L-3-hydroxyproline dehydratase|uniref:Proline racemase n=1 Tax=Megasphaera cerevisiae DSM 20462 TaxID=1122219 RepID=A0A0J6WWQ9_9FIRM|nr:proline racemase family protein [Megasphaera cerevisiae]KMO86648.1 proline racemase [Megasphaera cerevisiae DSM 20462]MCI1750452.1 proline racemase family protein [Megasphaera cerevisiae]OKY53010.1 proline racemase [Megasphaera cerevisiae]SJZ88421.1 proline racemase [Megasphaera cerevisiae DSM 20462]
MWHTDSNRLIEPLMENQHFLVIDSHTMGEPTRIVVDGFPHVDGATMIEKKNYIHCHYDDYRRSVMLEPRGHANMFGAVLMTPVHKEADVGVIFMDSGGYKNMCGHGSIGVASMLVDEKLVNVTEPYTTVRLDTPAGIVTTRVKVENGHAAEVTITNVPCFLYRKGVSITVSELGTVTLDIAFGGSFFALVNADELKISLMPDNIGYLIKKGMEILHIVNEQEKVKHPCLDIDTIDLVEFYGKADDPQATMKNAVIFGDFQIDRSPCGTGTSAKVAALHRKGILKQNELFVYESIMGTLFKARIVRETMVGTIPAVIPQITGSAYITGVNWLIVDSSDPFKTGFQIRGN